jgi:hypothetical protein
MIHSQPMIQPDLFMLIEHKTIVYPTEEQTAKREKDLWDAADGDLSKLPSYSLNFIHSDEL